MRLKDVVHGLFLGITCSFAAVTDSNILFSGSLSSYALSGMSVFLIGTCIHAAVGAWMSPYPFSFSIPTKTSIVLLILSTQNIAQSVLQSGHPYHVFPTVLAWMIFSCIIVGTFLYLLGYWKVGNWVSFIPYPVTCGFLAGSGYLFLKAALLFIWNSSSHLSPAGNGIFFYMFTEVLCGLILFLFYRKKNNALYVFMIASVLIFTIYICVFGGSISELQKQGFLLGTIQKTSTFYWQFIRLDQIEWWALQKHILELIPLSFIVAIDFLFNTNSTEIMAKKEMDFNQELKSTGMLNLLCAVTGTGTIGYQDFSTAGFNLRMQTKTHYPHWICAGFCFLVFLFGTPLILSLPRIIFSALLLCSALSILERWVVQSYFEMQRSDYLICILILCTMVFFGTLTGLGAGFLCACIIFILQYSQTNSIKTSMNGLFRKSNLERTLQEKEILNKHATQIHVVELQGYLFFGNTNLILNNIKVLFEQNPVLTYLIMDFYSIQGIDSSSFKSLIKLFAKTKAKGIYVLLSGLSTPHLRQFFHELKESQKDLTYFVDLDHALEWSENQILEHAKQTITESTLEQEMNQVLHEPQYIHQLLAHMEPIHIPKGHVLFHKGDIADCLYFIQKGVLEASLPATPSQPSIRLRALQTGALIGEMGLLLDLPRTADVTAKEDSIVYRLDLKQLHHIQKTQPHLASMLYKYISHHLMHRLHHSNQLLGTLLYQNEISI